MGAWSEQPKARAFDDVPRSSDDVYMLYTGGTTGMPKGVMWRHEDFFYACCLGGSPLDPIEKPEQIARNATPAFRMDGLALGPLMHGGGQWLTLIGLYGGSKPIVYCERSFDAEKVLDLAARERATSIGIIGDAMARPLAEAALAHPDRWDLSALFTLGNGGAMLSGAVKAQLHAAFPDALINDSYGASETGASGSEVGASTTSDRPAFATDGRTWVLDPDTLGPARAGLGQGRVVRAPRATSRSGTGRTTRRPRRRSVPTPTACGGSFPVTSPRSTSRGASCCSGGGPGCINTGGEKVFPEEVEAAIRAHPAVFDAVVVGVPDERFGQKVVALVRLRDGAPALGLDALQEHCRTLLAGYKVPRALLLGDAPRTNVGKPDYATATQLARERLDVD